MSQKILAIIPARGGSKGIIKKNLAIAYGKPLIQWTIEAALKSPSISKIIVSSDDPATLNFSQNFNINTTVRPDNLALDSSSSESVIAHCLSELDTAGEHYDFIILLQPTSPARNHHHIEQAIATLVNSNATSLISCFLPEHSPYKSFTLNNTGFLTGIINNALPFMPRQKLPVTYYPNGAIYIIQTDQFRTNQLLFTKKCIPFQMNQQESIDIDTQDSIDKFNDFMGIKNDTY